jgi:two-component system alkaline phosphatase synthesis response regulator PhoP
LIENNPVSGKRILLVEHEARLRESIALGLGRDRFACEAVGDGVTALQQAAAKPFDLVLVDLGAPHVARLQISRALRQQTLNRHVPIVIIAPDHALGAALTEIEHGADDFLMKPFGHHELAARARAALHRSRTGRRATDQVAPRAMDAPPIAYGDIRLDPARRHVSVGARNVQLTEQEFHLLYLLTGYPGVIFSRDGLLSRIWGTDRFVTVRSVDTLVSRLRRRIEPGDSPRYILTVRGVGYKLGDV